MDKPQNKQDQTIASFLLWTALDAVGVYLLWKYVIVAVFHAPEMMFGHWFALVLGIRIVANRLIGRLDELAELLEEIRDIQLFAEQNSAHKFNHIGGFLEKHFESLTRGIVAAKQEDKGPE